MSGAIANGCSYASSAEDGYTSLKDYMTTIKMLDVLGTIYQSNYLQETIFNVFWTRGESEVLRFLWFL